MPKVSSIYVCQQCGYRSSSFLGKCPECESWGSLVEEREKLSAVSHQLSDRKKAEVINLIDVKEENLERISTGIGEFDRVLGEGIVPGSVVLVAGEPGIGKSTVLTQLAINQSSAISRQLSDSLKTDSEASLKAESSVLYVAGEESASQIKIRVERIKKGANLAVLNETDVDRVIEVIRQLSVISYQSSDKKESESLRILRSLRPKGCKLKAEGCINLVIIDSIQTLQTEDLNGVAGSVGQVRESAHRLQQTAKELHIPVFIIGHVTKEGTVAGPKTLEHLVDVVLSLEGEPNSSFRILRTTKNRFGPTDEVGIFEMSERGMREVENPSEIFLGRLGGLGKEGIAGSAIIVTLTGLRPILVEVQALVTKSFLPIPRRVGTGIDNNRLSLLAAVLAKRLGLPLFDKDIFVNITGGLKVLEPAADLGIALSIISSLKEVPLKEKTVVLGEVGLLGEVREVRGLEKRIKEAKKLGFTNIVSSQNAKSLEEAIKLVIAKVA